MPSRPPIPRCIDCDYRLEGLVENRCPECGRTFDPTDAATFTVERRPSRGWLIATGFVWCYPLLWNLLCLFTWFVAWMHLGHAPQAWIDDPNSISSLVDVLVFISVLAIGFVPVALMCAIAANLWLGRALRLSVGRQILLHIAFVAFWLVQLAVIRIDPLRVGTWLMD